MFYEPSQKQWLFLTDSVFSKEECEIIIAYGNTLEVQEGNTTGATHQISRSSTISWMPFNTDNSWIYQRLVATIEQTNPNTFQFDQLVIGEPIQYSRYGIDDFYDWHIDSMEFENSPPVRKVSCSILLNNPENFEGGDFQIRAWNEETIKLDQGQGLFFASFFQHRVLPVTKGKRHALVLWFNGPAFR